MNSLPKNEINDLLLIIYKFCTFVSVPNYRVVALYNFGVRQSYVIIELGFGAVLGAY